jgi:hypothetical protein
MVIAAEDTLAEAVASIAAITTAMSFPNIMSTKSAA